LPRRSRSQFPLQGPPPLPTRHPRARLVLFHTLHSLRTRVYFCPFKTLFGYAPKARMLFKGSTVAYCFASLRIARASRVSHFLTSLFINRNNDNGRQPCRRKNGTTSSLESKSYSLVPRLAYPPFTPLTNSTYRSNNRTKNLSRSKNCATLV
jgi:hypothetical protein